MVKKHLDMGLGCLGGTEQVPAVAGGLEEHEGVRLSV